MFIKEIHVYLSNKARSTIQHTFTKEKEFPDKRGGRCPPGPTLNPPLQGDCKKGSWLLTILNFSTFHSQDLKTQFFSVDIVLFPYSHKICPLWLRKAETTFKLFYPIYCTNSNGNDVFCGQTSGAQLKFEIHIFLKKKTFNIRRTGWDWSVHIWRHL